MVSLMVYQMLVSVIVKWGLTSIFSRPLKTFYHIQLICIGPIGDPGQNIEGIHEGLRSSVHKKNTASPCFSSIISGSIQGRP